MKNVALISILMLTTATASNQHFGLEGQEFDLTSKVSQSQSYHMFYAYGPVELTLTKKKTTINVVHKDSQEELNLSFNSFDFNPLIEYGENDFPVKVKMKMIAEQEEERFKVLKRKNRFGRRNTT